MFCKGMYMKTKTLKILLVVEFLITVLILYCLLSAFRERRVGDELFREFSPDGEYELVINGMTAPNGLYSAFSYYKVMLYEAKAQNPYRVWFCTEFPASRGRLEYEVEWLEDGVKIGLYGNMFEPYDYILPFKTSEEDADRLLH